jgi:hypothetical protein
VTLEATVSEVGREDECFGRAIERFCAHFDSELVMSLTQMGDFHLFKLSPKCGSVVMGFGKAYRLDENLEVMTQIMGQHQQKR